MKDTDDIEIGSIWVRDGKKYKVEYVGGFQTSHFVFLLNGVYAELCEESDGGAYIGVKSDFLKDFTPYKPEYKYQYVFKRGIFGGSYDSITKHIIDEEAAELMSTYPEACYQKIEASKIEA